MSIRKSQASAWLLASGLAFSGAVLADGLSGSAADADAGYTSAGADATGTDQGMSGGDTAGVHNEQGVQPGAPGISSEPATDHDAMAASGSGGMDGDALSRSFESADADGDGQLTEDEFRALMDSDGMSGATDLGAQSFSQLDRDRDGMLSEDEVQEAAVQ